jgi:hypothetical protein
MIFLGQFRVSVDSCYSFIAVDSHHLLLAGLPAHCPRNAFSPELPSRYLGQDTGPTVHSRWLAPLTSLSASLTFR